jgi:uncharacterized membrane protein
MLFLATLAACGRGGSTGTADASAEDHAGTVMDAGPTATAGLPDGYQARGQEPGWLLTIEGGRIDYAGSYGKTRIRVDLPPPTAQPDGLSYVTPQLTLRVHYRRCNDVMSGRGFEHAVEVTVGGETHGGCGGDARPLWDL